MVEILGVKEYIDAAEKVQKALVGEGVAGCCKGEMWMREWHLQATQ